MEHDHLISTRRIEAFSDGVFAVVVTLLVFDLKIPDMGRILTTQHATSMLLTLLPQFIGFALSFFIVCIGWVNHHQFFYILRRVDRKLLWLNNLLLFWLCFIPFPTAFLGHYPTNIVAVIMFGLVLFFFASSFSIMSYYAMFKAKLIDEHIDTQEIKRAQRLSFVGVGLWAISIILAPISVYISLCLFFIIPLLYFVPRRIVYRDQ